MKKQHFIYILGCLLALSAACTSPQEDNSPAATDRFDNIWKFRAGEGKDSLWKNSDYNDQHWVELTSAKPLKEQNANLDNGFGWYRKRVNLSDELLQAAEKKGGIVLRIGKIGACDEVYFNGVLVGKTGEFPPDYRGYYAEERNYFVDKKHLNLSGSNLIAVKFSEGWGVGGFLEDAKLSISSAETNDKLTFKVKVNASDYIFLSPNPVSITVKLENNNAWAVDGILLVKLTTDDYQFVKTDSIAVKIKHKSSVAQTFSYEEPQPGFYRYTVQFKRNGAVVLEKKFNVGFEPEKINAPIDAQADFKAFWDNNLKELAKVAPQYKLIPQPEYSQKDYNVYLVEMRSFGNELIRGYYAQPKREGKFPVIVEYMGYGAPAYVPNAGGNWDGFAYFVLSVRGQALNLPYNRFGVWLFYGLESKENYYYRGAFLDVVRALDFVCSRPEIDSKKIAVRGSSQGGALSFVAAALDKRVKAAAPDIPFLSDYPNYFKITSWPGIGFGQYIEQNPGATWEDIYTLLSYFDIKNLAQWIECPLIMGVGVQDDVCPPHIKFAAYNQVKSEKRQMSFPEHGHSVGGVFHETATLFIREKLNVE